MSRQDENQPDQNVCSCPTNTGQINGLISNLELTFDLDLEVLQKIHIDVPMHMDCEVTKIHSPEVGISEYSSKNKKSSSKSRMSMKIPDDSNLVNLASMKISEESRPNVSTDKPPVITILEQKGSVQVNQVQPTSEAPKNLPKYVGSITKRATKSADSSWSITVSVKNLPKMDLIGSCDPYFQFYLDEDYSHGDRSNAVKNKRDCSWTFSLPSSRIKTAKTFKIRWFDFDMAGKDDHIGDSIIDVRQVIGLILDGQANKNVVSGIRINGKKSEKSQVSVMVNTVW